MTGGHAKVSRDDWISAAMALLTEHGVDHVKVLPLAKQLGLEAVAIGTNTDDLGDYRPGIEAAAQRGAIAPMVVAGLSKKDVRARSKELGLSTWNKPQLAWMSSRFP